MNVSRVVRSAVPLARRMTSTTLKTSTTPTEPIKEGYRTFLMKKNFIGLSDAEFVHHRNETMFVRNYIMYGLTVAGVVCAFANMIYLSFPSLKKRN